MPPRPNLFVIGAMKSGTTTLHELLGAHPSIFMSAVKEPSYFANGDELRRVSPATWRYGCWKDRDSYLKLFAEARDAATVGESSTSYTKAPLISGVAERIADLSADARIIYIVRDPIERTISHYWHRVHWEDESRDLQTALRLDPLYRSVSHYAMQLRPYLATFGADQVKLLTLEALRADPAATMRELYAWLGVDPSFSPPNLNAKRNPTQRAAGRFRGVALLRWLRLSRWYQRVRLRVPSPLRALGAQLARRRIEVDPVPTDRVIAYLRPLQLVQTRELGELTGRGFPEWRTLAGGD